MPRPISNPSTMLENGLTQMMRAYLVDNFATIAEEAGYAPQGGGSNVITIDDVGNVIAEIGQTHPAFETALRMVRRSAVYLYGPPGSGKSTIARNVAKALDLPCYVQGRIESPFEVFGFRDGRGEYAATPFRKAFERGGVYCLDELDRSDSTALTALNDALSSRSAMFPDGVTVEAHPDFHFMATGNSALRGDSADHVAAVEHDSAVADRLAFLFIDYDEAFERSLIPSNFKEWCDRVQTIRRAIKETGQAGVHATPRATITGAQMLHDGLPRAAVEDALIWRGVDKSVRDTITRRVDEIERE